jgi:hypothetical protein
MDALWDYIYSDEDYEDYDDGLYDSENLDWDS